MTKELQELMLLQSAMWDVLMKKINSSIIPLPSFKKVDPELLQECTQDLLDLIAKSPVPVPGFDYAKLKAARPTRRDRAVERWRNRIK
jgi:hypothetical protein